MSRGRIRGRGRARGRMHGAIRGDVPGKALFSLYGPLYGCLAIPFLPVGPRQRVPQFHFGRRENVPVAVHARVVEAFLVGVPMLLLGLDHLGVRTLHLLDPIEQLPDALGARRSCLAGSRRARVNAAQAQVRAERAAGRARRGARGSGRAPTHLVCRWPKPRPARLAQLSESESALSGGTSPVVGERSVGERSPTPLCRCAGAARRGRPGRAAGGGGRPPRAGHRQRASQPPDRSRRMVSFADLPPGGGALELVQQGLRARAELAGRADCMRVYAGHLLESGASGPAQPQNSSPAPPAAPSNPQTPQRRRIRPPRPQRGRAPRGPARPARAGRPWPGHLRRVCPLAAIGRLRC
eukprot:scaffold16985_cov102-Isochrysis_galbana.AAC.4